jgi:chromosome segregation ATPase
MIDVSRSLRKQAIQLLASNDLHFSVNRDVALAKEAKDKVSLALRDLQVERSSQAQLRADEAAANVDGFKARLDGITESIAVTQHQNDSLKDENASLRGKLRKVCEDVQSGKDLYDQQMAAKDAVLQAEQHRAVSTSKALAQQQELLDKLSGMLTQCRSSEAAAKVQCEEYQRRYISATEAVSSASTSLKEMTGLAKQLREVRAKKGEVDAAIIGLAAEKHTLTAALQAKDAQLEKLKRLCRSLQERLAAPPPDAQAQPPPIEAAPPSVPAQ